MSGNDFLNKNVLRWRNLEGRYGCRRGDFFW